jgi:hypothetical protein
MMHVTIQRKGAKRRILTQRRREAEAQRRERLNAKAQRGKGAKVKTI